LTASLQLWRGRRCPLVSQGLSAARTCGLSIKSPPNGRSFPVAYSAMGTVAYQPLTLSVALLSRGEPDPLSPPPRQKDDDFPGSERLPPTACSLRLLSHGGEERRAPASAICTIHEHDRDHPNPILAVGGCPRNTPLRVAEPLSGYSQPSFLGIRGSTRLSPTERPPDAIARTEVLYPEPRGPDTFCRELVARRLEKPTAPGVRSAHRLRAHPTSLLARDSPPAILLARDLPAGPLPAFLREEERARLRPRCLSS